MKVFSLLFLSFFLALGAVSLYAQGSHWKPIHLVIDPGHGGRDPGKPGNNSSKHEKDLNLAIALKLGKYIKQFIPNVRVTYTRKTDTYVSLEQRVEMANKLNADYFLSIHCNSNPKPRIYGAKFHIHSHAHAKSKLWARLVEKDLISRAQRKSRGIMSTYDRGYNLFVLQNTNMPALLAELGFMTNNTESSYLNSEQGQVYLASSLFRSFKELVKLQRKPSIYKVQILASKKKVPLHGKTFSKLGMKVEELRIGTNRKSSNNQFIYKYTVGKESTKLAAYQLAKKVKQLGFKDAFVIRLR